ncbi:MAG: hypothetical protein EOP04_06860 [Proteobacteria bacterium]|nr:MAG: hypothetical protein EOP04_06860 [Pseudomonadota bacterium]
MFTARQLVTPEEINDLKSLIYDVYIGEMQWVPRSDNPSGLRNIKDGDRTYLDDNYSTESVWFGVFHDGALAGGIRAMKSREGKLEVEHYYDLPSHVTARRSQSVEVNRMAFKPQFRESMAPIVLFYNLALYLAKQKTEFVVTTASEPEPAGLCKKLGFKPTDDIAFKYSPADVNSVKTFVLDCRNEGALERLIALCEKIMASQK